MKKFLIAVICIIPIIVVLALSATSDIILNFAPVNPESIVVKDSSNNEIDADALIMASTDTNDFLIIDIYPTITPDKSITYEQVGGGTASIELEQQGDSNRYDIIAEGSGAVSLIVRAKKNINVQVQLNFYVQSTKVNELSIFDNHGNVVESTDSIQDGYDDLEPYRLTGPARFVYDANPIDALGDEEAQWFVAVGKDLVSVDNGIVRPLKRPTTGESGLAIVKLELYDKDVTLHERYFAVDVSGAVASQDSVYADSEADLEAVIQGTLLIQNDLKFSYSSIGGDVYVVSGSYTDEKGEKQEFEFEINVSIGGAKWGFIDGYSTIYTNNGNYFAAFGYIGGAAFDENETQSVVLTSSDDKVLSVGLSGRKWKLTPLKAGKVTLRAEKDGAVVEKEIVVRERPLVIFQDLVTADSQLGIRMDRTWGTEWVKTENGETAYTSDFRMGIRGDTNAFDVLWTATVTDFEGGTVNVAPAYGGTEPTEEQLAPIGAEEYVRLIPVGDGTQAVVMRLNPQKMLGATMTLTASVLVDNRPIGNVTASFTFKFHDIPSVNVYTWDEMYWSVCNMNRDIIMQSAITVPDEVFAANNADVDAIDMRSSMYGNGFLFQMTGVAPHDKLSVFGIEGHFYHFMKGQQTVSGEVYDRGIVFEDMRISGMPTMDELVKISEQGKSSYFFCRSWSSEKITYRYCQIYNCTKGVHAHGSDLFTLEGCIIGDNYTTGGELAYSVANHNSGCKLVLKNNVFKTSRGPSLMISPRQLVDEVLNQSITPYISVEGFLDVYNWKTRKQLPDVFSTTVGTMVSAYVPSSLLDVPEIVSNAMTEVMNNEIYDNLFFNYAGEQYISLAVTVLGLMCTTTPDRITIADGTGMASFEMPLHDANGTPLGELKNLESLIPSIGSLIGNATVAKMKISHNPVIICPDFSTGSPNIMPGEQIPNDRELYDRLTGKA